MPRGCTPLHRADRHLLIKAGDSLDECPVAHPDPVRGARGQQPVTFGIGLTGTHKWLQGYLNEYAWRYNRRHDEGSMFHALLAQAVRS